MGFLTRLLAGLLAASTLGTGLAGTANAVDVTGAAGTTKSVVKLTADDTNNLPDHLVNGDFSVNYHDQWKDSFGGWTSIDPNAGKTLHATNYVDSSGTWKWTAINGWDRSKFGWTSTQKAGSNVQQKANAVELQYDDSTADNVYAELCAYEAGTAIYQDIRTTPGTLYKVRLKHASLNQSYLDKMQVMIGAPGHEQPVEMTRTSINGHGDKLNEKSTTIATKVTNGNNRHHANQWETYEGTYLIPDGQTTTRFTFRSIDAKQLDYGNVLDDIVFDKAYRLSYDKNASDATGKVPSNQRGKENTVEPAKSKTTGTVKTVVDTSDGLPTELVNGDFEYPGADVLSQNLRDKKRNWWGVSRKDKMVYESDNPTKWVSLPSTFDSDRFAWDSSEAGKTSGVQEGSSQWHTNEVELQRDSRTGNMYAELSPYQAQSSIRQYIRTTPGALYKVRLKHASLSSEYLDKMQVLIGADGNEQPVRMTRVESQNGLDAIGESTASTTISTHASNKAEISWGSGLGYHSSRNHDGQWATYEGVYVATSDVTVFTFKSVDSPSFNTGNLLDDVVFTKAYKLTYDKNSADASGQVPSNQRGKENTTQPAKTKTSGIVKTVADDTSNLPDHLVNGDFSVNYKDQWLTGGWNWTSITPDGKYLNSVRNWNDSATTWKTVNGWDKTKFGWSSTQKDGTDNIQHKAGAVEIQYDDLADNVYAELCAYEAGTAIYQDIKTVPGTLYKVRLKHASLYDGYLDKMQVMIGTPGHEQPVEMTRTGVNGNGDKLNEKSNIIATKVSNTGENDRNHDSQWESYEGTYLIPAGQTVTRFTFRSVGSRNLDHGNLLDDIVFDKAYRLDYDKNSNEAAGSVPSNQRGRENTVQPAKAEAGGTVRTIADASKSLTVNPGFDVPDYSKLDDGGLHWMYVNPSEGNAWSYYDYINPSAPKHQVAGLSQATFGWQELTGGDHKTTSFELHREKDGNVCADVHGSRTIGQTIDTQAGVAYTVSIRHSGRSKGNAGSVQVLVGPDKDHLQPLEMSRMNVSRTGAKYGDKTGKVGTVITTHSDSVDSTEGDHPAWDHSDDWETYSGTYVATGGKTVFAYRGVDENGDSVSGNDPVADSVIDDLSYETANTVKQAKTRTTGTVRAVADRTASGLTVHDLETDDVPGDYRQFVLNTTDTRLSQVEFENGAWYKSTDSSSQGMWPLKAGASLTIPSVGDWTDPSGRTHQISMTMRLKEWNGGSVSELYRFDGHGNIVGDGRCWINTAYGSGYSSLPAKVEQAMGKVDTSKRVGCSWTVEFTYADTGEKVPDTFKGVTGFNDLDGWDAQSDLKFEGVQLLSGFDGAYKRSDAELGTYGTNGFAGIKHDAGDEAHLDAPQQSRHRLAATWTGSTFTFSYDLGNPAGRTDGSRMTFGAPVTRTAVLTYDTNAADAAGSVPSDTTPGTTRTVSSKTDGKVSDLVQRTTTHEDGSVTVRTVDQSTDVVSGCQVYYPAGQKITLATMAKDDDCWDSSMLSRPGHTQLGWNQDRNATQAQAQVTMVEGGMTVYAVWVGNPVLTYDTNKPNTWTGEMPSTPASVSVAYNTAAADGSGWKSGDTSKLRGYKFLGWYTAPQDNAGLYDWTRPLTGSVTVYAHWQRLQANVVYNANGGTGSHPNTTGWQYSDVTIPGDTSKSFKHDGLYLFKHWNTQPNDQGTVYTDGSRIALQDKDITLYAIWVPYHENFVPTGGIGLPIAIAGGVLLLMFGIGSTVMLTRRMNGHGMPDNE
ncbi:InlB B-repeat-containing protein [Bifidobacterium adolescentis]|nr:InlB B-repeat-containing protein [Bifidobacterium adolescentis]MDB1502233.1 InlB B-repeat-containing protein [Bifidobacterium adolescentis]